MGVLSKALAIMLAVNMALMLALPFGVFADDIIISGDGYEVEYGDDSGGEATEPESQSEPAAEPESEPAATTIINGGDSGGIQPMAITPFAMDHYVDNWADLRTAITNVSNGGIIHLTDSFARTGGTGVANDLIIPSTKSFTIDGGGNTLDFRQGTGNINRSGFRLAPAAAATPRTFTLRNIVIQRENVDANYSLISVQSATGTAASNDHISTFRDAVTANWTINIEDLTTRGAVKTGLISASDSVASFSGNVSWVIQPGAANSFIWNTAVRGVTFEENSNVILRADGDVIVAIPATQNASTLTYVELKPGAQVNLHSNGNGRSASDEGMNSHHSAILMNQGANATAIGEISTKARALLKLSGANTRLYCSSDGNGFGYYGGVVVIAGGAGGGAAAGNNGHIAVDISGGATLEVMSNGAMPAMVQQVPNATLKVTGSGSELKLTMAKTSSTVFVDSNSSTGHPADSTAGHVLGTTTWNNFRAVLRFRYVGGQTFDVSDHANVSITRLYDAATGNATNAGRPAALRFGTGPSNSFYVTSGATVRIENQGNGSYYDADVANGSIPSGPGVGDNAAIEFDADYFTFDVSGEGSAIELIAAQGPAVDAGDKKYGKIVVGKDAVFQAKGSTKSAASVVNSAIFKAGTGFTFETNEPLYYDFQNARTGGGRIFNITSGSGADLSTFKSTHSDVAIWGNGQWASMPYQAVDGDPNQRWTGITYGLSGANFSTHAADNDQDFKDIFGPNGMTSYTRVSGNNSLPVIQSFLDLTNADKHVRVTGIVPEGLPSAPPRAIWTDEAWARLEINGTGQPVSMKSYNVDELYEVETAAPANGVLRYDKNDFLVPNDTYRVTAAWRGPTDNPSDSRNHAARTQDIQSGTATVRDVTPPTPVTIYDHGDNTIWAGQPDQLNLTGSYANMSTVAYNPEPITKIYAKVMRGSTVVYDGLNSPATLNTQARTWALTLPTTVGWQEDDVLYIIAVDSNDLENPLVDTAFRDTTFPAATSLVVKEFPIELSATNKMIGLTELRALQTGSAATQEAALKALIEATATLKPDKTNPYPNLNVSITENQGIMTEANTYQTWLTKYNNDDPKSFTITYKLDSYPNYTATAIVTVVPRDTVGPVAANDIGFSLNNAIDFLDKTPAEQYAYLLTATDAIGIDFNEVTGEVTYVPNDVHVVNHGIQPATSTGPDHYPINFARNSDSAKTGSAKARVIAGNTPVLNVTTPIRVWTGSLGTTMPSGFITVAEFNAMAGVTATDEDGTDIIDKVEITSNVGLALGSNHKFSSTPLKGVYEIDYKLTNDDNNTVTAYRAVLVDVFDDGGYVVDGYDFVATKTEVTNAGTAGKEQLVKDLSKGQAWRIIKDPGNPSETIPVSVPLVFKNNSLNPFTNIEADYPIKLGVNAVSPFTGNPIVTVTGKVVDKSEIGRGGDDATHTYYAIAANNVERPVPQMVGKTGTGTDVANWLKAQALPDAYRITGANTITQLSSATDITVFDNQIPANPVSGQTYDVTFEVSGVEVTVGFTAKGSDPIINFDIGTDAYNSGSPLVIQQTPGSAHLLTDAELKAKMTVTDAEDLNGADLLANHTTVQIRSGGSVIPSIDTQVVAVYTVTYTVTDSDGMWSSATRAIVVTDGRYVIDKGSSSDPDDGLILGAKNFVKQRAQVDGTPEDVLNSSFATAYKENGDRIYNLSVSNWPVPGYVSQAPAGTYTFVLAAQGYTAPTKTIQGIVTNADKLFPGYGNDQYAIAASHFAKNILDAETMRDSGDLMAAEIDAAKVTIYNLITGAPGAYAYVVADNSFPGNPVVVKPNDTDPNPFNITFGIKRQANNSVVQTSPESQVTIDARVSQGEVPVLTVTTPINVPLGGTFNPLDGVTIADAEDSFPTPIPLSAVTVTPLSPAGGVDVAVPGIYTLRYSYRDTDNNTVTKQRVVVVNDGHYQISSDADLYDGRILYASSFVVRSTGVEPDAQDRNAQIKSLANVKLYNGVTGAQVDASSLVTVSNSGSYAPTPATTYTVTLQATDSPSGTFTKTIYAQVVATEELVSSAASGTGSNEFGPTTYVYGSSLTDRSVSEAETIAAGGIPGIISALKAGATKAAADGILSNPGITLTDIDSFLTRLTNASTADDHGTFNFTVTDTENAKSLNLTIAVSEGDSPVLSMNKPLELNLPVAASSLDANGNLTRDQILSGVQVTDTEDVTIPLTAVTYDVADANGNPVAGAIIPGTVPGLYKVTYYVSDSDHNPATPVSRAIVVNDGRFTCDGNYVLSALSFIINRTDVSGAAFTQIIDESGAKAWDSSGNAANAYVVSSGYTNSPNTYSTKIGVQGYSGLQKEITIRVVEDANTATPGAHISDGNSDNGDRYAIYAHNFRINVVDAKALATQAQPAYGAAFVTRAGAMSYDRATSSLGDGGTATYVSDGGFAAAVATLAEGDTFEITFKVAQDDEAVVTIKAFVSNAGAPVINVPDREVWIGDPLDPEKTPGSVLPSQFNYITTGPVTVNDDIDPDIFSKLKYGTYDATTQTFTENLAPINFATAPIGNYYVAYSVTDADHNTTIVIGLVTLNDGSIITDKDYGVRAFNFVTTEDAIAAAADKNALILDRSYAEAWRYDRVTNGSVTTIVETPVTPVVKSDAALAPVVGEYSPIQIGVVAQYPYVGNPIKDIKGTVIDRDVIAQGPATGDVHYVVAANNIILPFNEAAPYGGALNPANSGLLVNAAKAVAYQITKTTTTSHGVTVVESTIPAAPAANTDYKVKFSPTDAPSIVIEINVHVNLGGMPVITFRQDGGDPLVIAQVPAASQNRIMTETELKDLMNITDTEDSEAYLLAHTQVYFPNTNPNVLPQIDKYAVGVYQVEYTVTDSQGNTDTAKRAIVINDGRFEIIDENGDGQKDIIIGARDFVLLAKDSSGQLDQVISASKVNIYDRQGTRLEPILQGGIPSGYTSKFTDTPHEFVWTTAGHNNATKKITGTLVDADVIYPGDDNDQYSIVANHFSRNTTDAAAMVATGDLNAALITAAQVHVYKLVEAAPDAVARVVNNGGFSATPNGSGYQIYFGARQTNPDANVPAPPTRVLVSGKVSNLNSPELTIDPTPLVVWIGASNSPSRTPGSILPNVYSDKYGVTASDVEDTNLSVNDVVVTYVSPTTGVDLNVAGNYVLGYSVTDSDYNETVGQRVVVVNDGTIEVGEQRLLYGTSFVTLSKNVTGNLNQLIVSLTRARVYDALTGTDYGAGGVTVPFNDNFSATPDDYDIRLAVTDGTTGTMLEKSNIIGRVVSGTVIGPSAPNPTGPTTYVYGTNLELTRAEAMDIADGGITGLKTELLAAASKVLPDGSIENIAVDITDTNSFMTKLASPNNDLTDDLGIFNFTVTDVENQTSIALTINVSDGIQPVLTVSPKPYSIPMKALGSPALTAAEIMTGVAATDGDEITPQNPTGDITNTVTYEVKRDDGTVITTVPSDVAAVYQVVYTVVDSDLNTKVEARALIVNDGSFIWDTEYILSARHFVVGASEIDALNLSDDILTRSNARAWSAQTGVLATAEVGQTRGYSATPGSYSPLIQVAGHPGVSKQIDALVINDGDGGDPDPGDGNGGNGAKYSITANNFRLNAIDAETLAATSAQNIAADFLLKSGARSYDRTATSLVQTGTPELSDDGGFKAAAGTFHDGDLFKVTFWVSEDHSATTDAWVIISGGEGPQIQVPDRIVWIGDSNDPRRPAGSVLAPAFHYINTGPVTVTDDYDSGTIAASLKYGTATYSGSTVVNFVEGTPVNLSKVGVYRVTYAATDSDYNTTYKTGTVTVSDPGFIPDKDFLITGYDFVETLDNVKANGDTADQIVAQGHVNVYRITEAFEGEDVPVLVTSISASEIVEDQKGFDNAPALDPNVSGALPATYTGIKLGYDKDSNPMVINGITFEGYPRIEINAKVIGKDVIDNEADPDPTVTARYIVAANNVTLFPLDALNYRGLSDIAKANLIDAAKAEGYITTTGGVLTGGLGTQYVDVLSNEMGAGSTPVAGSTYKVVFYPKAVPNAQNPAARIEVDFIISDGNSPVITFDKIPLVVNQGAVLDPRAAMTFTDIEDLATGYATQLNVELFDENGNALAAIDTSKIGVYKARYTAIDHETNRTTDERAIVVTDGRYVITDANGDGKLDANNVIIGARNFVIQRALVVRDLDTVRGLAWGEAFDRTGTKLSGQPVLDGGFPAGYDTAAASYGNYNFIWEVPGYLTKKAIVGTVLNADVIDTGTKDSQYAIAASHFQRNTADAKTIINTGSSAFITAANAQVIKLVDGVDTKAVVVYDRGTFTIPQGQIDPPAGVHQIVYGIDGVPTTTQKAPINGTISNRNAPVLTVPTPIQVWVGDAGLKPAGAIDPADYDIRYDVTLTDVEDAVSAADVTAVPNGPAVPAIIDEDAVGEYRINYSFTDSDGNPVSAQRVVNVNDGRYVIGVGRTLRGNPFVIPRSEVVTNTAVVDQHLLLQTQAKLSNGETGEEITGDQLFIANRGTYSSAVGVYDITVAGKDNPATEPDLSKTVKAEVVDAEVFEHGPDNPDKINYYIFGNNLSLTPAEAQDIVDAADSTAALLNALGAGSRATNPNGLLDTLTVVVDPAGDGDEFLANTYLDNSVISNTGTYYVLIKDAAGHISATLEVSVVSGNAPVITAVPSPLVIPIAPIGSGLLTEAQLMTGVTATDIEDDAAHLPLVTSIVGGVPSIAADAFSVNSLVYTVTDSAGNTKTVRRAVIVNDDTVDIGTYYILSANSFVIGSSMVGYEDVAGQKVPIALSSQILKESKARAWRITGEEVTGMAVGVVSTGNYNSAVGRYPIVVAAAGETTLTREIAARVFNDDTTEGTNGDQYSITADHFRVNVQDADLLVTKTMDEIAADFMNRAGVKSYKRSGTLNSDRDGTRIMTTDGGFKAHGPFALTDQGTTFQVTFQVSEDPTAFQTVTCLVSNALPPTLTVPSIKESPVNEPISDAFYREGVEAVDTLDGILTSRVAYDASAVDITQAGKYYPVRYWVTDSDNNRAETTGYIFINDGTWEFDGDYAVRAYDFITTAANVAAAGTDTNALTLALSHAEARVAVKTVDPDGFITSVELLPVAPVVKTGSVALGTAVGTYTPINIGVEAQAPYVGNPIRTIKAEVIDKDIISNKPEVDDNGTPTDPTDDVVLTPPDGNDQNPNDPSDSARYVVGANNVTLRYYEVADFVGLSPVVKARLISAAAAEAFKITSASVPFDVDVTVNDISANADAGDSFYVTFIVKGMPSVYAKAKFTVTRGSAPVLNVGNPLIVEASEATALLNESALRQGISATDLEDGILTSRIVVTEPGTDHLPTIDTAVPGIYSVLYTVTDNDGVSTSATRPVVVNDGRYELIDENRDGSIDIIIGAKNFVVKRGDCLGTVAQAKTLSYVEAYNSAGADLGAQVELVGGNLPQGYIDREQGVYKLTWTITGHPAVAIDVYGSIIGDEYVVTPIDKTSAYAIIAKDFSLNTKMAGAINTDAQYITYANAAVIKLVESGIDRQVALVSNGGFKAEQGSYRISFGAGGIATSKLSNTITATVTDGSAPLLTTDSPIIIRIGPAGTPVIDLNQILQAGHIKVVDSEAVDPVNNPTGDITSSALLVDGATNQLPSITADQPGVHQIVIKVVDADGNTIEKSVAVVVDDGNFVYTTPKADGSGFILRAHGFNIDLSDVTTSRAIDQIREESELQAWRNDGGQVAAAIVDTGGYKDAAGTYSPVVGIYDTSSGSPVLVGTPDLSKPIQVTVVDNYARARVTFDGNGGILVGPRVITVVEPQTTLPYLPASPIRDGYTFRYWSTSSGGGTQFTSDTTITSDITLYAIWTQNPVTPPPTVTPPPSVIVNNPPATVGGGTTVVVEPPASSSTIAEATTPQDSGEEIGDTTPPLANNEPAVGWALFDLLATIMALILLVVFFIKFFFDRPRDEEYEEEPIDAQLWEAMTPDQRAQYQARREAEYQTWQADQQRKANRQKALYVNAPVVLIVGVAFVEALIMLFTTQDFELNMSIVGSYSVVFALILFVQLLTPMVAAIIRNNRRENQNQKMGPAQPAAEDGGVTL
jgi:uncharacterized repeat protein (TIGR02543 family)